MKKNKFKLSPAGKLAAAIGIISVSIATCYAAGMVGAGDNAHRPDLSKQMGKDIINIVKPSASGLSHNQFQEFNVNQPGAVFNNSTTAGISQLAGQLSANSNLNGQAANIILNEVVGRNPSLLMGKQEVFGMAADYVLANPNGISCMGCGFINTNRTSLVVGNPLVEQGVLQSFNTANSGNQHLRMMGSVTTNGILDLIAPVIYSEANITAGEINALSGHNRVSTDGKLIQAINKNATKLDSSYLGGMQAGRINLVSTSEGSGVKISGNLSAAQAIATSIAGNLDLQAVNLQGDDINLKANNIRASGNIQENKNGKNTTQSLQQTKLTGKNITLVANKRNHLTATEIKGDNISLQGGDILLDTEKLTNTQTDGYSESGGWGLHNWSKSEDNKKQQQTMIGTTVIAKNDISLQSTQGDIKVSGSSIKAGNNLSAKAKKDVQLEGIVTQDSTHEKGHKYVQLREDKTWDNKSASQDLHKTTLQADGNLGLTAGGKVTTRAAHASAGNDLLITANEVEINVQKTINQKKTNGRNEQNLGLGGIDHNNNDKNAETSHRSEITANGNILITGNKGVAITGSKVKAAKDGYVQAEQGGIKIDNAISTTTTKIDERTGVAFNITGSSHKANNSDEKITGSELASEANLKIVSKDNVDVIGSLVKSAGELGIETLGEINVKAAVEQQKIDEQKTQLIIEGFTNDDDKNQYKAGIKLEHTSESEKMDRVTHHGATLEGGSIKLEADKDITVTGSTIVTTQGNADIKGENVSFVAAQDTLTSNKEKETIGIEAHYTGGMDKAGSGANVSYEETQTTVDNSTAVVSGSQVAGNLNITASKDVTNQGSDHKVDGAYQVQGENIQNLAAENREKTNTTTTQIDVGYGANIDYANVTRPIEDAIKNVQDNNIGGMMEATDNIAAPNAGVDLYGKGSTKETTFDSTQSVGTSIQGSNIVLNATDEVKDQGTKYQAAKGSMTLNAGSHISEAAVNRVEQQTKETFGEAGIRVATSTGSDISVDGKGSGGSKNHHVKGEIAQVGSINAANGININVRDDATYQGTNINAGVGKTTINAGGNVHFDQATHLASKNHNNLDADAKINFGTTPGNKEFGAGLGGGNSQGQNNMSIAQVSNIQGEQGVELNAGGNLTLTGTSFGSKEKPTGDILLTAGGKVDMQTAQSHSSKQDMTWSASANASASKSSSKSSSKEKNGKGLGAELEVKVENTDESVTKHQGSVINSNGALTIKADSNDEHAIHLQNANITSQKTVLTANNGGILLESAQDKEHKNNWGVNIAANASQNTAVNKDDKGIADKNSRGKQHDIGAKLAVGVDKLDSITQQNTQINSSDVVQSSAKDTELAGAIIAANNINGTIGGDLKVQSRTDELYKTNANVALGASHNNGKQKSMISQLANVSPIGTNKIKKKLDEKSTKLFDKAENKYDQLSSKFTTKEEDNVTLVSYTNDGKKVTLDESKDGEKTKDKWWQKGAKTAGKKVKSRVQEEQAIGGSGSANIDVNVVENNAVEAQSAISGKQSVNLNVKGKTQLIGGKISNKNSDVVLNTNEIELQDIEGKHTEGGARVNGSSSIGDNIKNGFSDVKDGKIPLISAHGGSEQKNADSGITRG
ncbi:hemagglutinin repeat-containing protein [Yersinia aleksiciae]|uniref:hemagglutinin repeat-containing protein n=1 Tax=Yersinia aleksiciae TaxID=263819 RepID=UPI0025AB1BF7|nr:hemagglutinin repeat-containing protein [Yersinia aleksiciae]MDN0124519.1 hemagglutinin repeat-containing protein [Yersinia aleksiciae]